MTLDLTYMATCSLTNVAQPTCVVVVGIGVGLGVGLGVGIVVGLGVGLGCGAGVGKPPMVVDHQWWTTNGVEGDAVEVLGGGGLWKRS